MQKRTIGIIIALVFVFTMVLILGQPAGITGFAVTDRIAGFFVKNSLSSMGPITVLAIIFAAAVVALYETVKK